MNMGMLCCGARLDGRTHVLYKQIMGYPGEPEEPGADKFYTGCSYLLFSFFFILLLLICGFTGGVFLLTAIPFASAKILIIVTACLSFPFILDRD